MNFIIKLLIYSLSILIFISIVQANKVIVPNSGPWAGWSVFDDSGNPNLYTVNAINGSWIVQNALQTSEDAFGSQWIGIGGFGSTYTPLLQIGTVSNYCPANSCNNSPTAFWEMSPFGTLGPQKINLVIKPGDIIYASIHLINSSANPTHCAGTAYPCWELTFNDISEIESNDPNITYASGPLFEPNRTSADWEEESKQNLVGSVDHLSKFSAAYFGPQYTHIRNTDYASINLTTNETIGWYSNLIKNIFAEGSSGLAYPSNVLLSPNQASFVVYEGPELQIARPTPQYNTTNLGSSEFLTDSNAFGGSGNFTYHWLWETPNSIAFANVPAGCGASNTIRYLFVANSLCSPIYGQYYFELEATDAVTGLNVTSAPARVYVLNENAPAPNESIRLIIPLNVSNNQDSPIYKGVQFALTFNAPNYSHADLNPNLSNICVGYNGSCITAWIQGNLSEGVNGGGLPCGCNYDPLYDYPLNGFSDLIWVKAQATINADSTTNNYSIYVFPANTDNYQNSNILGANPNIVCASICPTNHYGGADNGGLIFNEYDNFINKSVGGPDNVSGCLYSGPCNISIGKYLIFNTTVNSMALGGGGSGGYFIDNGIVINPPPLAGIVTVYTRSTFGSDANYTLDFGGTSFSYYRYDGYATYGEEYAYHPTLYSGRVAIYPCNYGTVNGDAYGCYPGLQPSEGFYHINSNGTFNSFDFGVATMNGTEYETPYPNIWIDDGAVNVLQTNPPPSLDDYYQELSFMWSDDDQLSITQNYSTGNNLIDVGSTPGQADNFGIQVLSASSPSYETQSSFGAQYRSNYFIERLNLPNNQQPTTTGGVPQNAILNYVNYSSMSTRNMYYPITVFSLHPNDNLVMTIANALDPITVNGIGSVTYGVCSTMSTCLASGSYTINVTDTSIGYTNIWPLTIVAPVNVVLSPVNQVLDQGQQMYLNSTVVNGTGIFNYQWYNATSGSDVAIANQITQVYLFNATNTGTYKYNLLVTDAGSGNVVSVQSNNVTVIVKPELAVNTIPTSSVMLPGTPLSINALATGGTGNFVYQWYNFSSGIFPVPIANQIANSITLPFNTIGSFSYILIVTDQGTTTPAKASVISIPVNITIENPIVPVGVKEYLPITLLNYQNTAITANTPIAIGAANTFTGNVIGFNAIAYQQYETCNLNNGEFFFKNGTVINSWLEGNILNEIAANTLCASSNSANALAASANILYWIDYSWPSSFLPANTGSNTIYLGWAGNVVSAANTLFGYNALYNAYIGEAPQLSCNNPSNTITGCTAGQYGKYDYGSSIFKLYYNFIGTSTPSGLVTSGTYTQNNGIYIPSKKAATANTMTYYSPGTSNVFEGLIQYTGDPTAKGWADFGAIAPGTNSCKKTNNGICWILTGNSAGVFQPEIGTNTGATITYDLNWNVYSAYWPASTKGLFNFNYGTTNTVTATASLSEPFGVSADSSDANGINLQWIRIRQAPPNDILPGTVVGNVI